MHNTIIVRYGEIALKGKNRKSFEQKLVSNIISFLKGHKISYTSINRNRGRILIHTNKNCDCLKYVFGIASFSYAVKTKTDLKGTERQILKLVKNKLNKDKTFRISTNRVDKQFKFSSLDINKKIGESIKNKTHARVNLKNPDLTVGIEISDHAYIFINTLAGTGGLPVGIEGKVYALIENKADSLAAVLAMKRGCVIIPVAHKKTNISLLKKFDPNLKTKNTKNLSGIEKEIPLVVGQTLGNLEAISHPLVLRPLVAYSKSEITAGLDHYTRL